MASTKSSVSLRVLFLGFLLGAVFNQGCNIAWNSYTLLQFRVSRIEQFLNAISQQ